METGLVIGSSVLFSSTSSVDTVDFSVACSVDSRDVDVISGLGDVTKLQSKILFLKIVGILRTWEWISMKVFLWLS